MPWVIPVNTWGLGSSRGVTGLFQLRQTHHQLLHGLRMLVCLLGGECRSHRLVYRTHSDSLTWKWKMATVTTFFFYKQVVFHFHVSESEGSWLAGRLRG